MSPDSSRPARYRQALFILLVLAWLLVGLLGRDAWKSDEAETLGRIMSALDAGWQSESRAPLFPWIGALFSRLLSPFLPLIDAARLATVLCSALALWFTGLAARELYGPGRGWPAALLLMGCFGMFTRGHGLFTESAFLLGAAMSIYGMVLAGRRPYAGAAVLALGLLVTFHGQGPEAGLGMVSLAVLPLLFPNWRNPRYLVALGLAAAVPLLAWQAGDAVLQFETASDKMMKSAAYTPRLLAWFAWPLWPLAIWTLWWERRRLAGNVEVWLPLLALAALFLLTVFMPGDRELRTLPLLVPLALLAAAAPVTLTRGASNGFYWFSAACFLFFIAVFWVYWSAMDLGWPAGLARHLDRLYPDYRVEIEWPYIGVGALACLTWLALLRFPRRDMARPVVVWASGMVLVWVLLIVLLKDWAQGAWGYEGLMHDLAKQVEASPDCVQGRALTPAVSAMLAYHTGIRPLPAGVDCGWLLEQWNEREQSRPEPEGWRPVWEGYRPRVKHERLTLYTRG